MQSNQLPHIPSFIGKKNIDVKAVCTKAKDAFDQTFNLLRCELANSNKYRIKSVF